MLLRLIAVGNPLRVNVISRDRICGIVAEGEGTLAGRFTRERMIEFGDDAARTALEAMSNNPVVNVEADNYPRTVDILRKCSLTGRGRSGAARMVCASTHNIKGREGAAAAAHYAVVHKAFVNVESDPRSCHIDA